MVMFNSSKFYPQGRNARKKIVQLKGLLEPALRPVVLKDGRTYRLVTVKLYGKGVLLRDRVTVDDLKGDKWFQVKEGDLIFSS